MDGTTTLASDLLEKLAELNQKVCDYRQDMVQEFQRYQQRLLHDAPEHVSAHIEDLLAAELHNYPALNPWITPDVASADRSRSAFDRWGRHGRTAPSPPPILPHTSGVPPHDVASRSPDVNHDNDHDRDRDREFHGLFTPVYLPLLEVNQTTSTPNVASSLTTPRTNNDDANNTQATFPQLDVTPQRPDHIHNDNEDTTSSVNSDDSSSRTRRSALRRSSSASIKDIQSPRRVRFDVEGEEVLPTVSPPISPRLDDVLPSPPLEEQAAPVYESLNHAVHKDSLFGSSPPRPKKISSTERLKALARSSTEDTSKWTVVGNVADDDEDEEGLVMTKSKRKPNALVPAPGNDTASYHAQTELSGDAKPQTCSNQDISEADGDLFELTPLSSFKDKKRFSPRIENPVPEATIEDVLQQPSDNNMRAPDTSSSKYMKAQSHEEDDFFKFEDDDASPNTKVATANTKYVEEEEEEAEEQVTPLADNLTEEPHIDLYSTSPAIAIAKPASLPAGSGSYIPKRTSASTGSYKGKPFIISVVRDEELQRKAEQMGDIASFVGSVDGRSGFDPSDSFRQAPYYSNPPSTSRSLDRRRIADNAYKQASNQSSSDAR
ncbi:hypothetical protein F4808DRAFT_353636 [Astrocystis sublimbata]|nr:hypothetical protein F4808DRAFT_353636 [Astrocystis sublimbata]